MPDKAREKIIGKLNTNKLPRALPSPPAGDLQGRETMRIGVVQGTICSGCGEPISGGDAAMASQFAYSGSVVTLDDRCFNIWDEERHRPRRRK